MKTTKIIVTKTGKNKNLDPKVAEALNNVPEKRVSKLSLQTASDKSRFLNAMMSPTVFTILAAAELANVSTGTVYRWKREDADFATALAETEECQIQRLEQRANERAMGINISKPSDLLMIFLLNGNRPTKYRQNQKIEHSGSVSLQDLVLEDDKPKQLPGPQQ